MKVYHGSYTAIDEIDLNRCEVGKDFGQGFYVTKLQELKQSAPSACIRRNNA